MLQLPNRSGNLSNLPEESRWPILFMHAAADLGKPMANAEIQMQDEDGTTKSVLASASPLMELSGKVRGAVGIFFDVTHRKRLADSSQERAQLLELASEAIMVRDKQGVLRYWNSGAESLYGWKREEILGQRVHDLLQSVFPIRREELKRLLTTERFWQGNLVQRARDGRGVVVASRMALDPETNAILEINRDITSQLRAEEAIRQAEKMAAMGRMAGIIAHEINNPLEAIMNTFHLLRSNPSLDDEAKYYASLAEQELQRVSHITRQTLSFYRESKQPIRVSLIEVMDDVLELQQRKMQSAGITLQKRYRSSGEIYGFPAELRQVFLNLIGNAVQAMPHGGTLRVQVAEITDPADLRRGISISLIDTGTGIRPEDAEKLFEPFFSTKSTKGTGLGLWISKGIIQKYEGRVTFRSQCYRGGHVTCFRLFLPVDRTLFTGKPVKAEPEPTSVGNMA